jgi:hypothetical protein
LYEFEAEDIDPSCKDAWRTVKGMGSSAYPYLLVYIADEDPQRGQAAAAALRTLAEKPGPLPKPGTGAEFQKQIKEELKISDEDLKKAEETLKPATPSGP